MNKRIASITLTLVMVTGLLYATVAAASPGILARIKTEGANWLTLLEIIFCQKG